MKIDFFAHSAPKPHAWETQAAHARRVADKVATFSAAFGAETKNEAYAAGLLHDIGKYGELFQKRLHDHGVHGVDHWTAGAWALLQRYNTHALAATLAVEGHHTGLRSAPVPGKACETKKRLEDIKRGTPQLEQGLRLSSPDLVELMRRFENDGHQLPQIGKPVFEMRQQDCAVMLDVRMLYSALVDADFLAKVRPAHVAENRPNASHHFRAQRLEALAKETLRAPHADPLQPSIPQSHQQGAIQPMTAYSYSLLNKQKEAWKPLDAHLVAVAKHEVLTKMSLVEEVDTREYIVKEWVE